MSKVAQAARRILSSPYLFSKYVIRLPLRKYQREPVEAAVDSILNKKGLEFIWVMPRQSGKNEGAGQLKAYLLNIFQRTGGQIVFGAIGDGVGRGARRLEERLDNPWNAGKWHKLAKPMRRVLGKAAVVFISSSPTAHSRGETAHHLLMIDELQDNDASHLEAVFEPMRAANNATAIYIGTVRLTNDALWQKKLQLEQLQKADGIKRVYFVYPDQVIAENPHYKAFLDAKILKFGRNHPIIASEYFLEPIDGAGGLFPDRRQALMRGTHERQHKPQPNTLYIAVLDVAGQDEAATDAIAQLDNPARDYTALHIVEVIPPDIYAVGPTYLFRDVWIDQGSRHFQDIIGKPSVAKRLIAYLKFWGVGHIISDATGVGEGMTDYLAAAFGQDRVTAYKFNSKTKAELGNNLISVIETNRFKYWVSAAAASAENIPLTDEWWIWQQVKMCGYSIPAGGSIERNMQWGIPATVKIDTPKGKLPLHDDRLLSAALIAAADELYREGKIRGGSAESFIATAHDPITANNPDDSDLEGEW